MNVCSDRTVALVSTCVGESHRIGNRRGRDRRPDPQHSQLIAKVASDCPADPLHRGILCSKRLCSRGVNLARRTWREVGDDDVLGPAAQLSYYFFLALVPAILFLLALANNENGGLLTVGVAGALWRSGAARSWAYERVLYTDEIFFATSTSRSVTLPPTSYRVSSKVTSPYAMCTSGW
jgi:hypothetical protein